MAAARLRLTAASLPVALLGGCIWTDAPPDADGDGASVAVDCDDADPSRAPGVDEVCNGVDDDCDGLVDEEAVDATISYRDQDGDGYGDEAEVRLACGPPEGFVERADDCDDRCATCAPGLLEVCDGRDNDCDGEADEAGAGGAAAWYADEDGDGYGDPEAEQLLCAEASGLVSDRQDCDDGDATVHPGAQDLCGDAVDGDCDGALHDCHFGLDGADAAIGGLVVGDALGTVVHGPGDVDGDGLADLLLSAPQADAEGTSTGSVYLLSGPFSGSSTVAEAVLGFAGAEDYDQLGTALGHTPEPADPETTFLLVGAAQAGPVYPGGGAVYLLPADATQVRADRAAIRTWSGPETGARAGASLDGSGDLDGDGIADLVVGLPGAASGAGEVHVLLGPLPKAAELSDPDAAWVGPSADSRAGEAVAVVGDTDGDGADEVLLGGWGDDADRGAAWLVTWSGEGSRSLDLARGVVTGEAEGDQLGHGVAAAGDLDGDGLADLAVGAWLADSDPLVATGSAYLVLGPASGSTRASDAQAVLRSTRPYAYLGFDLVAVGDVDGSGLGDLLLAGWYDPMAASGLGSAVLVLDPLAGTVHAEDQGPTLAGADTALQAGGSVAALGDTDGDGLPDLALGSLSNTDSAGAAWVVRGRESW